MLRESQREMPAFQPSSMQLKDFEEGKVAEGKVVSNLNLRMGW